MTTKKFLEVNTAVIIPVFVASVIALTTNHRVNRQTLAVFFMTCFMWTLTFFSKRFAEYGVPVAILFCAFFFTPFLSRINIKKPLTLIKKPANALVLVLFLTLAGTLFHRSNLDVKPQFAGINEHDLLKAARVVAPLVKPKELIFTCDWDDPPPLFYGIPNARFLVFLDPTFLYFSDSSLWSKWRSVSEGRVNAEKTYQALQDWNIRIGVCTNNFDKFKRIVKKHKKMKVLWQDSNSYAFQVE